MAIRLDQINFGSITSDTMLIVENGRLVLATSASSTVVGSASSLPDPTLETGEILFDSSANKRLVVSDGTAWLPVSASPALPFAYAVYRFAGYTGDPLVGMYLVPVVEEAGIFSYDAVQREITINASGLISVHLCCPLRITSFEASLPPASTISRIELVNFPAASTMVEAKVQFGPSAPTPWQAICASAIVRWGTAGSRLSLQLADGSTLNTYEIEANSGCLVLFFEG